MLLPPPRLLTSSALTPDSPARVDLRADRSEPKGNDMAATQAIIAQPESRGVSALHDPPSEQETLFQVQDTPPQKQSAMVNDGAMTQTDDRGRTSITEGIYTCDTPRGETIAGIYPQKGRDSATEPRSNISRFLKTAYASSLGDDVASMATPSVRSRVCFDKRSILALLILLALAGVFALGRITVQGSSHGFSLTSDQAIASGEMNENSDGASEFTSRNPHATGDRSDPAQSGTIVVYVSGKVKTPGVVELDEPSRINDAIDKCGGMIDGADGVAINLAAQLKDGDHIHVPGVGEEMPPGTTNGYNNTSDSQDSAVKSSKDSAGKININTASRADLESIAGIGPVTADAIITWREENGAFRSVDDLLNVSGIGEKTLESLRDFVTAS